MTPPLAGVPLPLDTLIARVVGDAGGAQRPSATVRAVVFSERPDRAYEVDFAGPGARGNFYHTVLANLKLT